MRSAFFCALLPMLLSMKSSGQPDVASLLKVLSKAPQDSGRVMELQNISAATCELITNEPGLTFIPRGKVQAKGKVEVYFVGRS